MSTRKYDCVVVGSGAGGATLEELVQHDKNILAIEVGQNERVTDTLRDARSDYDGTKNIIPLLTI
jgi:choline dehydrogenase-like flavoprotein